MPNSFAESSLARVRARRRGTGSLVGVVLALMTVASCTGSGSPFLGGLSMRPTSTLEPTLEPTASPTPEPTIAPTPDTRPADLAQACTGHPVAWAGAYSGTLHPLVVAYYNTDYSPAYWAFDSVAAQRWDINARWYNDDWPGPVQLVLCVGAPQPVKTATCGWYKRTSDGKGGNLMAFRQVVTVRVVVASTGKTLQSKTFNGASPGCPANAAPSDLGGSPPWHLIGNPPNNSLIDTYATAVSTQKA